jgi:hypothetical protein
MDWLAALPTVLVVGGLVGLFVWLGRNHRRTWGEARGQEPGQKPPVRESTWMRGSGGHG